MERIALAVGADRQLTDFFSITEIMIYEKQKEWVISDCFPVPSEWNRNSTVAVRVQAEYIGKGVKERNCNHIIGKEIVGIPYHMLCKSGLEVFEADEISNQLFQEIYEDFMMKKEEAPEVIEMVPPNPIPLDDEGNYILDFVRAIKCHPELSSKKMLLPFLTNDLFFSLLIRCEHIMPWLDEFIKIHELSMNVKRENGGYDILITHEN